MCFGREDSSEDAIDAVPEHPMEQLCSSSYRQDAPGLLVLQEASATWRVGPRREYLDACVATHSKPNVSIIRRNGSAFLVDPALLDEPLETWDAALFELFTSHVAMSALNKEEMATFWQTILVPLARYETARKDVFFFERLFDMLLPCLIACSSTVFTEVLKATQSSVFARLMREKLGASCLPKKLDGQESSSYAQLYALEHQMYSDSTKATLIRFVKSVEVLEILVHSHCVSQDNLFRSAWISAAVFRVHLQFRRPEEWSDEFLQLKLLSGSIQPHEGYVELVRVFRDFDIDIPPSTEKQSEELKCALFSFGYIDEAPNKGHQSDRWFCFTADRRRNAQILPYLSQSTQSRVLMTHYIFKKHQIPRDVRRLILALIL